MNMFAPNINHEILFVINIGEFAKVTLVYRTYKDSDTINNNMCVLSRYIFMTYINIQKSVIINFLQPKYKLLLICQMRLRAALVKGECQMQNELPYLHDWPSV